MKRREKIGFQQDFYRVAWLLLLLVVLFMVVGTETASAIERNRKNLLKLQLKSDKKEAKSRVVMRLNQGGYYEIEEDYENRKLIVKLFEFHNFGAQPLKVLNDPLIKGINVSKKEQYLEIAIYLKIDSYSFKVSLFESPAMCVLDIKATELIAKDDPHVKKPVAATPPVIAEAEGEERPVPKITTEPESEIQKPKEGEVKPELKVGSGPEIKYEKAVESEPALRSESGTGAESGSAEIVPDPASTLLSTVSPVNEKSRQLPPPDPRSELLLPTSQVKSEPLRPESKEFAEPSVADLVDKPENESLPPAAELVVVQTKELPPALPAENIVAEPGAADTKIEPLPGQELFDQGLKAYQEVDYVAAEEFFSQLIDSFPDSALKIPAQFRRYDARAQAVLADGGHRDRLASLICFTCSKSHRDRITSLTRSTC